MWQETAIEIGINAVKRFFDSSKKDNELISMGVAVGYFYNFLDMLSKEIEGGHLDLYRTEDDKNAQHFDSKNVKIQVIIPKKLDVYSFKNCENEFARYKKSLIYSERNKRFYGINFFIAEIDNTQNLTIVDLARPIMAVKHYYENILRTDTGENNEKWRTKQLAEITAFKNSLIKLQLLGSGTLVNQLDFPEIG